MREEDDSSILVWVKRRVDERLAAREANASIQLAALQHLRGRVWNTDGTPLVGYTVLIYDTFSLEPVGEALTNSHGIWTASIPDLPQPWYWIVVGKGGGLITAENIYDDA